MIKNILFFCFSFTFLSVFSQADDILGNWLSADKKAHIEIYKVNNLYYGKMIWLREPNDPKTGKPKLDKMNPTQEKKSRPLLNLTILYNFKFENNEYSTGFVYVCRSGKVYDGKLWLSNNNSLNMRGYAGIFFSTEVWSRIK